MKRFFLLLSLALTVACKPGEQAREQGNRGRYLLQPNFAPIRGSAEGGGI